MGVKCSGLYAGSRRTCTLWRYTLQTRSSPSCPAPVSTHPLVCGCGHLLQEVRDAAPRGAEEACGSRGVNGELGGRPQPEHRMHPASWAVLMLHQQQQQQLCLPCALLQAEQGWQGPSLRRSPCPSNKGSTSSRGPWKHTLPLLSRMTAGS